MLIGVAAEAIGTSNDEWWITFVRLLQQNSNSLQCQFPLKGQEEGPI
jgi:hypothetical protein